MKLSRTVAYALQATMQLAESNSNGPIPCSKLAADGAMPERFLLQILRNLVTHGILNSTRGVDGGYTLTKPPEQISILDVIEAIDGPLGTSVPVAAGLDNAAHERLCAALREVSTTARHQLESIKLSHLISAPTAAPTEHH